MFRGISWQISQIFHLAEKHTCETYTRDFFILKMFSKQCENILESKESSDDEVYNYCSSVQNHPKCVWNGGGIRLREFPTGSQHKALYLQSIRPTNPMYHRYPYSSSPSIPKNAFAATVADF